MSSSDLDCYLRRGRRRSSRPYNPFKSIENQVDLDSVDLESRRNSACDDGLTVEIKSKPFSDFYNVDVELGRGKFATVKKCYCKLTGKAYAAKFQRKRRKAKDARAEIIAEIRMLEMCRIHPNVIDLVSVFETRHEIIIVTEYCSGGELYDYIEDSENGFSEADTKHILKETLEGLAFLHQRNIVHMDVKPQNLLLSGAELNSSLKICDLGFSRAVATGEEVRDLVGTPDFVAPEVLSYEPISTASDMWSVGVLAYMLLTGHSPFAGNDKMETYSNISSARLDFPENLFSQVCNEAKEFIKGLLLKNPSIRLTVTECLEHAWFTEPEIDPSDLEVSKEELGTLKDTSDSGRETLESGSMSSLDSCAESMWTAPESLQYSDSDEDNEEFVIAADFLGRDSDFGKKSESSCAQITSQLDEFSVPEISVMCSILTSSTESEVATVKDVSCDSQLTVCRAKCSEPPVQMVRFETLHEVDEEEELSVLHPLESPLSTATPASAVSSTVPTPSPMSSPIGCRRALVSSPQTVKDTEPSVKHLCRREDTYKVETTILLDFDLAEENSAKADRRSVSCVSHKSINLHKIVPSSQKSLHLKSC